MLFGYVVQQLDMPPIVREFAFPADFHAPACQGVPSERDVLAASLGRKPDNIRPQNLTGVDMNALHHLLSSILDAHEQPRTSFIAGGLNSLYRFEYPSTGHDVVARIPMREYRDVVHIETTVATTLFVQHCCNIPVPDIIAWHGRSDNPIRVPFIIMNFIPGTISGRYKWHSRSYDTRAAILERLARSHPLFLRPVSEQLTGPGLRIGVLSFANDASDSASVQSYTWNPMKIHRPVMLGLAPPRHPTFTPSSTSLSTVWRELWAFNRTQCLWDEPIPGLVNVAWNSSGSYDIFAWPVPLAEFLEVAAAVQKLMEDVLRMLEENPAYTVPCVARNDYALRNVLLDENSLEIKSFIDFDDVTVAPLILHRLFPLDLLDFSQTGVPESAPYYHGGAFEDFPPDEFGPIFGPGYPLDFDGSMQAHQRILITAFRTLYKQSLSAEDARIARPEFWNFRNDAVKVHTLLTQGTEYWWIRKDWLLRYTNGTG